MEECLATKIRQQTETKMNKQDRLNHTFKLWKDFSFEAAHQLTKVPPGHQCGRLHGHSYKVRIHCEGKLDPSRDWVVDYAEIAGVVRPVIQSLDHTNLNDRLDCETTAENLAWWLAEKIGPKLPEMFAVEVFETPTTSVICDWQRNQD
jgi:6-pyruvoyltetrahydropterin/6-carboxytetrahydropterin synthase